MADETTNTSESAEPGATGEKAERTFKQSEVEAMIRDRLASAQRKVEDAAKRATEDAERKALEEKQEWEKVAEKNKQLAAEASAKLEALQASMRDRAIRHAVEIEASRQGFIDPGDAVALADLAGVQYLDDDGKVTGVDTAIKALAKAKPHLVKAAQNPPANLNGRDGGKAQGATIDDLVARKRASGMYTPI